MAQELILVAEPGRPLGSRPSRRLRRAGRIPGVVYGHGMQPLSVSVNFRDLRSVLTTEAGTNAVIDLEVGGERHLTIVRELQRDRVRHDVLHVDFGVVSRTEEISVDVPVVLHGEAEAVRREQGVVEQALFTVTVKTTPTHIPAEIPVDVSGLAVGDTVRVGDLSLPGGVSTDLDPEEPVVVAQVSRATMEAEQLEAEVRAGEQPETTVEGEVADIGQTGEVGETEETRGEV